MNRCYNCGTYDNLTPNGKYSFICKDCNTKRVRKYRLTPHGRRAVAAVNARARARNLPLKKVWRAAEKIPAQPCEVCGATKHVHRHHDDYSKPLDVTFLCPVHHTARHRQLKPVQIALV